MARETIPYTGITEMEFLYKIAPDVIQYAEWYATDGMFLPGEYKADPAAWTQILRDIQAAFAVILKHPELPSEAELELMYNGLEKYYTYSRYLFKP